MLKLIDNFLDRTTMYRLILYYLSGLLIVAFILSLFGILPYNPISLAYSVFFITLASWIVNEITAAFFKVPTNVESVYITALILALIITPVKGLDLQYFGFLAWVAVLSQSSKYVFALYRKHFFNPVAFAVVATAFIIGHSASWWVGTTWMLPFVLIGGILMARKTRRFALSTSFIIVAIATILGFNIAHGLGIFESLSRILISSPLFFFAFVILTEPLTTPPTKRLQIMYGALVGLLFAPQISFAGIYSTPELALIVGNIFSYVVSPKKKLLLTLRRKIRLAPSIYSFVFTADTDMKFKAGQYMEWTLAHNKPDNRGNRRYFTLASAPTEREIILGVKFYNQSSSYKVAMLNMKPGTQILAGQLSGDFILPKNSKEKSVFIAGGIGVTPFRSMVKYLVDTKQSRDIVMFYSNKIVDEVVYNEIFDEAVEKANLKMVYTLTDNKQIPNGWPGRVGMINAKMIQEEVPDFSERTFYISGPHAMVTAFDDVLTQMGVSKNKIKTDFFPGFV